MLWIFKIGNKVPGDARYWLDGQLVDIMPSTTKLSATVLKHFFVIEDGLDYWKVRGDTDWKSTKESVLEFRKLWSPVDGSGKYPWDFGYDDQTVVKKRNRFIDFKDLLDQSIITESKFADIYTKSVAVDKLSLSQDITQLLKAEGYDTRLVSEFSETKGSIAQDGAGSGSGGGFTIGAAGDYATVTLFEADIASQLTGDLHGLHLSEETSTSSDVTFDTDTNGYTLYLTAESGCEHNGGAYGNGARIAIGDYGSITLDETNDGDLDDVEISQLAIDASGTNVTGIRCYDGANSGSFIIRNNVIMGSSSSISHISTDDDVTLCYIYNNIGYNSVTGIYLYRSDNNYIYNNTFIGNGSYGIRKAYGEGNYYIKNNLCQGNGTDYSISSGYTSLTTAYNISEDATSPDASYQSKDLHTNSIFQDYSNNDYRLDSAGDATNLAIADDGEDLSGTFTDDIQGQTRSTWYIGASEIVSGGGVGVSATCDSLTLTEYAATVNAETSITAGYDALTLTEYAADVDLDVGVVATCDSLTLTEYATVVEVGGETEVSATCDSLTLTEYSATINAETSIEAGSDSLTLTEYAADVDLNVSVVATCDSLTLTEYAATVNAETSIEAGSDSLTLTEYAATVNAETSIEAGSDSLTLTEYAADIDLDVSVEADCDSLTLMEYAAAVNMETNVAAGYDILLLTEYDAAIAVSIALGTVDTTLESLTAARVIGSLTAERKIEET